jgi:hypothetical protein
VFERTLTPKTPPLAYSTNAQSVAPVPAAIVVEPESSYPPPPTVVQDIADKPIARSDGATQPESSISQSAIKSSSPSTTPSNRSMSPLDSQSNAISEKRTTPKLNRSSGTRALAQAQMFEAMAAGKKPNIETQPDGSGRISQANSNADSGSEYSRDSQEISRDSKLESKRLPSPPPPPAPLALAPSKIKAPLKRAETSKAPRSATRITSTQRSRTPPRQRSLTDPRDPAVFGARPQANRERRLNEVPTNQPSTTRSSSQLSYNRSPRPPLSRRGTEGRVGSPQAPSQGSPRAPPPQANKAATRTSLASTMTTGRENRGMATRIGERGRMTTRGGSLGGKTVAGVARKTTSALFREIDELVRQDLGDKKENTDKSD